MSCQFRGSFSRAEKERIETAARAVERVLSRDVQDRPAWAFLHFDAPYDGHPYWGVRLEDGLRVGANTAEKLAESLEEFREDTLRIRERRQHDAGRVVHRSWNEANV